MSKVPPDYFTDDELDGKERCKFLWGHHWQGWVIFLVPILCLPLLFLKPEMELRCAYVLAIMAIYWITEVLPLGITSLIPIVMFPLLGILDTATVCLSYFKNVLLLFFGGLVVAMAVEYSNLHTRVALNFIKMIGCSPLRLMLSLIVISTFLSMWISNAATTAMMCPIIKAILEELSNQGMATLTVPEKSTGDEPPYPSKIVIAFYLSVAYASSFGGLGTLIGTGTNFVFKGLYEKRYNDTSIDFLRWMGFCIPLVLVSVVLLFLWMQFFYCGLWRPNSANAKAINAGPEARALAKNVIEERRAAIGKISCHEIQVAILFILMIVLFFTQRPGFFPGWADVLNEVKIKASWPAITCTILLFLFPVNYYFLKYCLCKEPNPPGERATLMTWRYLHKNMPWGLLLLLGGGFALSEGIKASGFAVMVGNSLNGLKKLPAPLVQFFCIVIAVIMTAFSANMAMCNVLVPILLEMAPAIEVHPAYLAFPATLGLSMAFHFPVSTPANAIAAGVGNIRTKDMAIGGIGASLIGIVFIFIFSQTWIYIIWPDFKDYKSVTAATN